MAPYTMYVELDNQTKFTVISNRWQRLKGLDGSSTATHSSVGPNTTGMLVDFKKSDGTDGLFSGATWNIKEAEVMLFFYARMPASSGGEVSVDVELSQTPSVDVTDYLVGRAESLKLKAASDSETRDAGSWGDRKPTKFTVETVRLDPNYPNAYCKLRLLASAVGN